MIHKICACPVNLDRFSNLSLSAAVADQSRRERGARRWQECLRRTGFDDYCGEPFHHHSLPVHCSTICQGMQPSGVEDFVGCKLHEHPFSPPYSYFKEVLFSSNLQFFMSSVYSPITCSRLPGGGAESSVRDATGPSHAAALAQEPRRLVAIGSGRMDLGQPLQLRGQGLVGRHRPHSAFSPKAVVCGCPSPTA